MSTAVAAPEREVSPVQLSLEQLNNIKGQFEEELQELQRQFESLTTARSRFNTAKATLQDASSAKEGDKLLVPLNSSLYVPGKVVEPNKVVVELGTGYFCEKTIDDAIELIDRKTMLVIKSIESVENVATQKKRNLDQIMQVIQYKIQMAQQQKQQLQQQQMKK